MKNVIKVITPGILITILCYLLQGGKNILDGIYIIFPIILNYPRRNMGIFIILEEKNEKDFN